MKKKRALAASRIPDDYDTEQNGPIYTIRDPARENNAISMVLNNNEEMVRITRDGFWVRGVKVPQDDREAEIVYNAFREWMIYSAMTRSY
jgi:hypothetical protein